MCGASASSGSSGSCAVAERLGVVHVDRRPDLGAISASELTRGAYEDGRASASAARRQAPGPGRPPGADALCERCRAQRRSAADARRHLLVSLAERDAVADERLGRVGRSQQRIGGGRCQALAVDGQSADEDGQRARAADVAAVAKTGGLSSCRSRS